MSVLERFTHREVLRILGVTEKQLAYWERLGFARPRARWGRKFYGFRDLISLRTVKQLTEGGVPARRLHRAIGALERQLPEGDAPLTELRIRSNGRNVVVEQGGAQLEPLSGQLLLDFETRELGEKVRALPERSAREWFAAALAAEAEQDTGRAVACYRKAAAARPEWFEAHVNLGTLLYARGELEEAAAAFRRAAQLEPRNPAAHFNLGTVLDETGHLAEAREHLRTAVRLDPAYADAHYNLGLVCEKLGAAAEAVRHWRRYLEIDPRSEWAEFARQHLPPSPQNSRT